MNILIINWRDIRHPEAGGAEIHLHEIFERLAKKKHAILLLTTRFKGCKTEENINGIHIYRLGHKYTFNWETPLLVQRIKKKHSIDCIVDDVNKIPFFTPRWHKKTPVVVFFHHLFGKTIFELTFFLPALYVLFLERLSSWGYRGIPCFTVSKSTASELIAQGFDEKMISIIENSVDTDLYCPDSGTKVEEDLLFFAGRLKRYKNVAILLDVIKMFADRGRRLRLVIAGTGDDQQHLINHANLLGIQDQVEFLGYIDEKQKIDYYRRAVLFINPSLKEGWGITNIESNACGTAVIANDAPGLRDSVKHEITGLLYRENDADDLVKCIEYLIDNPDKREDLEKNGREWALSFSWDNSAQRMEKWLSAIVQKKPS